MGAVLSRFRRKKATKDELTKLKAEIDNLENRKSDVARREKRSILILRALALVSVVFIVTYWYYTRPMSWALHSTYFSAVVLIPYSVWHVNKLVRWYHSRKVRKDEEKLKKLKEKKSQVIKNVMETETFIVAKEILELHAPEFLNRHNLNQTPQRSKSLVVNLKPSIAPVSPAPTDEMVVRRRLSDGKGNAAGFSPPVVRPQHVGMTSPNNNFLQRNGVSTPPGPPLPQPVLPQRRSYADRFMDYLIGDGPSNRFALICKKCDSHNGMALQEEFEYISFRCCYCYYWNPSRKQRPTAPKLIQPNIGEEDEEESSESSEENSVANSELPPESPNQDQSNSSVHNQEGVPNQDPPDSLNPESPNQKPTQSGVADDGSTTTKQESTTSPQCQESPSSSESEELDVDNSLAEEDQKKPEK